MPVYECYAKGRDYLGTTFGGSVLIIELPVDWLYGSSRHKIGYKHQGRCL